MSKELCRILNQGRIESKMSHWRQFDKKFSTHKALDFFYKETEDIVDKFVECYIGKNGVVDLNLVSSKPFDNAVKYYNDLYKKIEMERVNIKESFLQNIIDEYQAIIMQTIYKLTFTI